MRVRHRKSRESWLKKPVLSGAIRHWLVNEGSLTANLLAQAALEDKAFSVRVMHQSRGKVPVDEANMLGLKPNEYAVLRDVYLYVGDSARVFAHSVLPTKSLRGEWLGLRKLGNRPLGGALFADKRVKRTALRFKKLSAYHPISMRVSKHIGFNQNNLRSPLWARRSIFGLKGAQILVTEVFLPTIEGVGYE